MDTIRPFTKKQKEMIKVTERIVVFSGGMGSGKSTVGGFLTVLECLKYNNNLWLLCGLTLKNIRETIWNEVLKFINFLKIKVKINYSRMEITFKCNNTRIICREWKDKKSHEKLRSLNIGGATCEEVSSCYEEYITFLLGRLRVNNSSRRLFLITNPSAKSHFLYRNFIDKKTKIFSDTECKVITSTPYDNPYLPNDVMRFYESLKGVYRERLLLGNWAYAEGRVYNFEINPYIEEMDLPFNINKPMDLLVGVDHGQAVPTAFLKIVYYNKIFYVIDEYYESGKSTSEYIKDFKTFIRGNNIFLFVIDPAASQLKKDFSTNRFFPINAKNNILNGITCVNNYFFQDRIKISRKCNNLINELENYIWDKNRQEKGEDKPVQDCNDHLLDCLRYIIYTYDIMYSSTIGFEFSRI